MRKLLSLKLISLLLLTVILTAMTHGLCDEAHASHHFLSAKSDQTESLSSPSNHCTDCPVDDHDGGSGNCDSCTNCICHTFSLLHHFNYLYLPFTSDLLTFQAFKPLPEVYLSKFIPPQNTV